MKRLLFGLALLLLLGGNEKPRQSKQASKTINNKPTSKPSLPASEPAKTRQKLTGAPTVLLVGDSLSRGKDTVGGRLAAILREAGAVVTVNALGSRRAVSWLKGTTVAKYGETVIKEDGKAEEQLAGSHYDYAIIFLGTNDAAGDAISRDKVLPEGELKNHEKLYKLVKQHADTVIAISPPLFSEKIVKHGKYGTYDNTINDVAEDYYIEYKRVYDKAVNAIPLTTDLTEPSQGRTDYVHFVGKAAQTFAERLADEIIPLLN